LKNGPISPFVDQSSPNLVGMYESDRIMRRRFPVDGVLFQSGDICNEVAKWRCGKDVFRPKISFGRRTPKIRCRQFMPLRTHIKQ